MPIVLWPINGREPMTPENHTEKLLHIVRRTLNQHHMIPSGSSVVTGVSGGPDSVALLHVLNMLRLHDDFRIIVAHLDHSLRPESDQDAQFVNGIAEGLGIRAMTRRVDVRNLALEKGISVEEAGRRARYSFFEHIREKLNASAVATAHHRDDAEETFLLRILRGTSYAGLRGIPAVRGHIVRPFINAARSDILGFLNEQRLPYLTDPTNLNADMDRNFIRNRVLPSIAERFSGFHAAMGRTMDMIAMEDSFMADEAAKLYAASVETLQDGLIIDVRAMLAAPKVLQARMILKALYDFSGPEVRWTRAHVDAALKLAEARTPSGAVHLPSGLVLVREYGRILLRTRCAKRRLSGFSVVVSEPGEVEIAAAGIRLAFRFLAKSACMPIRTHDTARVFFDADQLPFPLTIRNPLPGDRFKPWGMQGTRKLKSVLIDAKVPLSVRRLLPLLVKGDDILWITGLRRGAQAAVGPQTVLVLEVELVK